MKSSATLIQPRKPWADGLIVFLFVALLWLPTLDFFTGIDLTGPTNENRRPAAKPRFKHADFPGLQNYLADSEAYFDDHFGFRKRLIRWCQQWRQRLFRDHSVIGKRLGADLASNGWMVGQGGWLFITERQMVDHYLGFEKFTPPQLQAWQRLLERRRDWLAARGIKYLFVVPPDKHTIYPEYLPGWLVKAGAGGRRTKLDQFMQYMTTHSTVAILDLRQTLSEGKKVAPTYLQHDTHWNYYGGFLAAQELVKALSRQVPELPPLRLSDFDWTNLPCTGGDLAQILGSTAPENNFYFFTTKPPKVALPSRELTNVVRNWKSGYSYQVNRLTWSFFTIPTR